MEINEGTSRMQVLTAVLANIPSLIYGVQIGWLSPMAPLLQSPQSPAAAPLTDGAISWLAAALPLAAVLGVPAFSYASDRYGRKVCIVMLSVLSAISWNLKLWLVTAAGLGAARALAGAAAGGCFLVTPLYVRETARASLRGALGSLLMISCNLGVLLVYGAGMSLDYFWNQWLYLVVSFGHIALFVFMPESPAFLVKMGKEQKALEAMSWLRGLRSDDLRVLQELKQLREEEEARRAAPTVSFVSILKDRPAFAALRMCLVLIGVQTLSGCFAVINYAASIFERAGVAWSTNMLALIVGTLQMAGSLVALALVERCGRKILLASSSAVISLCMASIATAFLLAQPVSPTGAGAAGGWVPAAAACVCIFAYGCGVGPVPFIVMAESFSFQHRARLLGVVMMFSWTNSTLTVLLFAPVASALGEHAVFYTFALVAALGAAYTAAFVPETRGKSVHEIQMALVK